MISEKLIFEFGAEVLHLENGDHIFMEGRRAHYYYQVQTGSVKMFNLNESGKEFVQGIFTDGQSFGEPPLFGDFKYPASAITTAPTTIIRLLKEQLITLLRSNQDVHLEFTATLSKRLSYKSMILQEVSVHTPEHRILTLVDFLKKNEGNGSKFRLDLTRQQIADLTGLRVETVIRAFKHLESEGEIEIINRKIFR